MLLFFSSAIPPEPSSTLFPYTTLFRSGLVVGEGEVGPVVAGPVVHPDRAVCVRRHQRLVVGSPGAYHVGGLAQRLDRKSTRLNSSHVAISYAVFCLKKKTNNTMQVREI